MNAKSNIVIPEPIVQLQRQFEQFRSSHALRTRIPEALWRAAVELARQHGLNAVAHPLRLDYTGLKRRLADISEVSEKRKARTPGFVELVAPYAAAGAECVIEFESQSGGKMRIQWKGSGAPDWSSLLRAWREAEG
ncbi:MAG TPA: hypothetical protein VGS41_14315 [Chthonomonadales bacterium]|nr:hypothetical protein [Chthonomonadales bacterium]